MGVTRQPYECLVVVVFCMIIVPIGILRVHDRSERARETKLDFLSNSENSWKNVWKLINTHDTMFLALDVMRRNHRDG